MLSLRNLFELDFPETAVVRYELNAGRSGGLNDGYKIHAQAHIDFIAHVKFCSFYIPPCDADDLLELCKAALGYSRDVLALYRGAQVTLPKANAAWRGAKIAFKVEEYLDVNLLPLEGREYLVSEFQVAPPIYIYADQELLPEQEQELIDLGRRYNAVLRVRGPKYLVERMSVDSPIAFISHDSRDKDAIARPLATGLSRLGYSVWFDEFTLKPGDRLRESIEKGLKDCRKCVLVLTKNFLENGGWTAAEFNMVFSREIVEERAIVVPVWAGVTKEDVYNYSPSLLNVLGAHWDSNAQDKSIKKIASGLDE